MLPPLYFQLPPPNGDVTVSAALMLSMIVIVVSSLATVVTVLYKAQTAGYERMLEELKHNTTQMLEEAKNGADGRTLILAQRVDVLTQRETFLLEAVQKKDEYVLKVQSDVLESIRLQTAKHDEVITALTTSLRDGLQNASNAISRSGEEHRVILEAIQRNTDKLVLVSSFMENVMKRLQEHEQDASAHVKWNEGD